MTLSCPRGFLAAGVIGTTAVAGAVGNFGLICKPDTVFPIYTPPQAWKVVMPFGTVDTHELEGTFDLNTYLNEAVSRFGTTYATQPPSFSVCPHDYHLLGIDMYAASEKVQRVDRMRCGDLTNSAITVVSLRRPIGSNGGHHSRIECNPYDANHRRAVKGLTVSENSVIETKSIQLICE